MALASVAPPHIPIDDIIGDLDAALVARGELEQEVDTAIDATDGALFGELRKRAVGSGHIRIPASSFPRQREGQRVSVEKPR